MASSAWVITADKFLTIDQAERLLTVLRTNKELAESSRLRKQHIVDYFIVRTLLGTGLRVAEFCDLRVGDFSGSNLNVRCGKGRKPRTILLTSDTQAVLSEWIGVKISLDRSCEDDAFLFPNPRGGRLTTRAVQNRVKLAFNVARLPEHFTTHSLRHTYCSFLLKQKGVSLAVVRGNMGHSSLAVTNIYSHAVGSLEGINLLGNCKTSSFEKDSELSSTSEGVLSILALLLRNAKSL